MMERAGARLEKLKGLTARHCSTQLLGTKLSQKSENRKTTDVDMMPPAAYKYKAFTIAPAIP